MNKTILDEIAAYTRLRVEKLKEKKTLATVMEEANSLPVETGFPFEKALKGDGVSFICEVKRASPSKGMIAAEFPYLQIAKEYENAGAAAISVLTEPKWFMGCDQYLSDISKAVSIPVLRKDFTLDAYMIYEAKCLGASAVLLICALLDTDTIREYIGVAHGLGLSALVEAHTQEEVRSALEAGARVIGVNNRDLKTFQVDLSTSLRLRALVPSDCIFVSESGIKTTQDIKTLRDHDVDAVLIGETFMTASDKKRKLAVLKGEIIE